MWGISGAMGMLEMREPMAVINEEDEKMNQCDMDVCA